MALFTVNAEHRDSSTKGLVKSTLDLMNSCHCKVVTENELFLKERKVSVKHFWSDINNWKVIKRVIIKSQKLHFIFILFRRWNKKVRMFETEIFSVQY